MTLGEAIRTMRLAREWRLEDLSERSGVDVGTISALENRNSTRSKYAKAIADAFGCSVDELLAGQAQPDARPEASRGMASIQIGPVDIGELSSIANTEQLLHIKQLADSVQVFLVRVKSLLPQDKFLGGIQAAEEATKPRNK